MCNMKRQKDIIMEDENLPSSESVQYATGEEQRAITNISRKDEVAGPKQKWRIVVDMSGGESKVHCCKEQYSIKIGDKRRGRQRMKWIDSTTNSMDMNLSTLPGIAKDTGVWHSAVYLITKNQT